METRLSIVENVWKIYTFDVTVPAGSTERGVLYYTPTVSENNLQLVSVNVFNANTAQPFHIQVCYFGSNLITIVYDTKSTVSFNIKLTCFFHNNLYI